INAVIRLYSQTRKDGFAGLLGAHDRHDLEFDQIGPVGDPFLQQARVVAFHDLEAAVEVRLDPAADIFEPIRRHAPLVAETAIDRLGVAIAKPLDHHELHDQDSSRRNTTQALVPPKPNEFDSTVLSCTLSRRSRTIGISSKAGST